MVLAVGTGRALRALPKANQPRGGGVFHRQRQKAIQQAGMAIFPCAAGLCSFSRLGLVLDKTRVLPDRTDDGRRRTTDGRNRATPRPPFQEREIAKKFIAKKINGDFNKSR